MSFRVTSSRPSNNSETTPISHASRGQATALRPLRDAASRGPLLEYTQKSLQTSLWGWTPESIFFEVELPHYTLRGCTLQSIKNKIQNVGGHGASWTELYSCPQVMGRGASRTWTRAQPGSERVRACGKVAHGPTLITINYRGVCFYTTQSLLVYSMWD